MIVLKDFHGKRLTLRNLKPRGKNRKITVQDMDAIYLPSPVPTNICLDTLSTTFVVISSLIVGSVSIEIQVRGVMHAI